MGHSANLDGKTKAFFCQRPHNWKENVVLFRRLRWGYNSTSISWSVGFRTLGVETIDAGTQDNHWREQPKKDKMAQACRVRTCLLSWFREGKRAGALPGCKGEREVMSSFRGKSFLCAVPMVGNRNQLIHWKSPEGLMEPTQKGHWTHLGIQMGPRETRTSCFTHKVPPHYPLPLEP